MTERQRTPEHARAIDTGARLILERLARENIYTWTREMARQFAAEELQKPSSTLARAVQQAIKEEDRGYADGQKAARQTIAALKKDAIELAATAAAYRQARDARQRTSYQIGYVQGYEQHIARAAGIEIDG